MKLTNYHPVVLHRGFKGLSSHSNVPDSGLHPLIDINETALEYIVMADVPGMSLEDTNISITDGILTISGEKKSDLKSENGVSRRMERSYGAFNRSFRLPSEINSDEISAAYKNGVLTILLPKLETAKPKVIPISAP